MQREKRYFAIMITYTVQCAYFYPATKSSRCTYTCNLEHKTTAKLDEFSFVINRLPAAAFNWIYIFTQKKVYIQANYCYPTFKLRCKTSSLEYATKVDQNKSLSITAI